MVRSSGLIRMLSGCGILFFSLALNGAAQSQSVIVAFGDSNTYGMNMPRAEAYPAQLEAILRGKGRDVRVVNAGVPGDTTSNGLSRLDSAVPAGTKVAIVTFGVNDGRRGVPPEAIEKNLGEILSRLREKGVRAVLCFRAGPTPPGYDKAAYRALFRKVGRAHRANPCNFRQGIPPNGYQADGHENPLGTAAVARNLARIVEPMIR
jgi:acyl-CoA thioesterase I